MTRRKGQTGQLDYQARSHDAVDCGSYRLVERTAPNTWTIEMTAACDDPGYTMTVRFVSRKEYARHF